MSENIDERDALQEEEVQYTYSVAVKFRNAGKPYSFGTFSDRFFKGDMVVVETQQGYEIGEVEADAMQIEKYHLHMPTKPVVRRATERDMYDYEQNLEMEESAFRICQDQITELGLDMNLLSAQYTLDRSKILFIYLADQRVDFRELLKKLGSILHCRIELRQIGERDKAKIVGGIGMCGMECCCRRYKERFDVISINMAKNQMLALNIEKLSGMCGKLMCCLKYEDSDYKQATEGLPKMGSQVEYEDTIYRITSMNVMNQTAKLENRESAVFITFDDLKEKAIPRKGVIVPRKPEGEEKKVIRKTVTRLNDPQEKRTEHVSMELPSFADKENRNPKKGGRNDQNSRRRQNDRPARKNTGERRNERNSDRNNERFNDRNRERKPEVKNVTVRTFGKKKKQEE